MRIRYAAIICISIVLLASLLGCGGTQEGEINVSINVQDADRIGAIQFELVYDANVLQVNDVRLDALGRAAQAGYNAETPGRLFVVIQNAPNIDGDGKICWIYFQVLNETGTSNLVLENVISKSLDTQELVESTTTPGTFNAATDSITSPIIVYSN